MTGTKTTKKRLEDDELYLTIPGDDATRKSKYHVSVILNFMSKAHLLGYSITTIPSKTSKRVYIRFDPVEPILIDRLARSEGRYGKTYRTPWILDRVGSYAESMICRESDKVDTQYVISEPKRRNTLPKKRKSVKQNVKSRDINQYTTDCTSGDLVIRAEPGYVFPCGSDVCLEHTEFYSCHRYRSDLDGCGGCRYRNK